ncbi:response regulator [Massilia sp. TSP1-1-2]|uniref:response regulator n=1 Tax=unclassified Massilia TaxID=2609279 RepID=UPI003CEB9B0C
MTAPRSAQARPLVLLVDDQPVNIQVLYAMLKDEYEVCMALNGADALAICREQAPAVLLLDIEMPGMDGYEVCRQLKGDAALCAIPVIFVSGHLDPELHARALALGGADFLVKPFSADLVQDSVRRHVPRCAPPT